jgi:hypothetical protein
MIDRGQLADAEQLLRWWLPLIERDRHGAPGSVALRLADLYAIQKLYAHATNFLNWAAITAATNCPQGGNDSAWFRIVHSEVLLEEAKSCEPNSRKRVELVSQSDAEFNKNIKAFQGKWPRRAYVPLRGARISMRVGSNFSSKYLFLELLGRKIVFWGIIGLKRLSSVEKNDIPRVADPI